MSVAGHETGKRFSRVEVQPMLGSGIFEDQRLELIDGDLIVKTGQNPPHASVIRRLRKLLAQIFEPLFETFSGAMRSPTSSRRE
jgi:hypothetical protein